MRSSRGAKGSPMPVAILKRERGRLRQRPAPSSGNDPRKPFAGASAVLTFPLMDSSEEALPPSRTESKEILGTEENPPSGSGRDTQGTSGGERGKAAG